MRKKINGIFVLALMVTVGCSSQTPVTSADITGNSQPAPAPAPAPVASTPAPLVQSPQLPQQQASPTGYGFDKWQTGPMGDVFYDFDSSNLSTDAQDLLRQNAAWLERNSSKDAVIEGHCDERGTNEYNLALGQRRAGSAKTYLVKLGVASSRLETVSYGEERPFDAGKNEDAWAKNRRAHFIVK